jgi:hypothetical protein
MAYIFHICGLSLQSGDCFHCCAGVFSLMQSHLLSLSLIWLAIGVLLRKLLLCLGVPVFYIFFSFILWELWVSYWNLWSILNGHGSSFCLLLMDILFSQHHLLRKQFFGLLNQKVNDCSCEALSLVLLFCSNNLLCFCASTMLFIGMVL